MKMNGNILINATEVATLHEEKLFIGKQKKSLQQLYEEDYSV